MREITHDICHCFSLLTLLLSEQGPPLIAWFFSWLFCHGCSCIGIFCHCCNSFGLVPTFYSLLCKCWGLFRWSCSLWFSFLCRSWSSFVSFVPPCFPFCEGIETCTWHGTHEFVRNIHHHLNLFTPPRWTRLWTPPIACSPLWSFVVVVIVDVVFLAIATTLLFCSPLVFTFMQMLKLLHWSCSPLFSFLCRCWSLHMTHNMWVHAHDIHHCHNRHCFSLLIPSLGEQALDPP